MKYLILTFGFLIAVLTGIFFSSASAQVNSSNTNTNTNLTNTIMTKFFGVEVLYESPHSFILQGDPRYRTDLWQSLDFAKENGYHVDAVAQITESNPVGDTRYLNPVYTIFMSK